MHYIFLKRLLVATCVVVLLSFSFIMSPSVAFAKTLSPAGVNGIPLSIPYYSQYAGQATQNVDCGAASVAMTLSFYQKGPGGSGDGLTQVRNASNNTQNTDLNFSQLESALSYYGSTYMEIPSQYQPYQQVETMKTATDQGYPVIALIHGADFGRGSAYGDHWVVVLGIPDNRQIVYLNDPDNQAPRSSGWIQGGQQIAVDFRTFNQAVADAQGGSKGIVVRGSKPTYTTDCAHLTTPWVALYQYANFGGRELCFEGTGLINLSEFGFDMQTMSINIAASGTFFDQSGGQGNQLAFYYGDEQADLGAWDNRISSFRVDS